MPALRVAIIGYGRSGRDIHTHLLRQMPGQYQIVAYADTDAQRRAMIERETGLQAVAGHRELITRRDQFDLVINASFSDDHAPISRELLAQGINVLSEKPAARDPAEFGAVLDAAKRSGARYHVFQQYRFSPAFQRIQEVIASGILGRIVQVGLQYDGFSRRWDWQTMHARAAGSLLNTGPHPVDHALALMGFPEDVQVVCRMDCAQTFGDGEDYVKLLLCAPGSPVADIEISACNAFADCTFLIQGTRGTLKGGPQRLLWRYYSDTEAPAQRLIEEPLRGERGEPIYCGEKLPMREGEWSTDANDFDEKGLGFYRALYDTYVHGAEFPITSAQVALQMHVMHEAHAQNKPLFLR